MTPHRTRYPDIHEAAGRPITLPRDLKDYRAANEDDLDEIGTARFVVHLLVAACMAFALIWIALALPEDAPMPASMPNDYVSAPR